MAFHSIHLHFALQFHIAIFHLTTLLCNFMPMLCFSFLLFTFCFCTAYAFIPLFLRGFLCTGDHPFSFSLSLFLSFLSPSFVSCTGHTLLPFALVSSFCTGPKAPVAPRDKAHRLPARAASGCSRLSRGGCLGYSYLLAGVHLE